MLLLLGNAGAEEGLWASVRCLWSGSASQVTPVCLHFLPWDSSLWGSSTGLMAVSSPQCGFTAGQAPVCLSQAAPRPQLPGGARSKVTGTARGPQV